MKRIPFEWWLGGAAALAGGAALTVAVRRRGAAAQGRPSFRSPSSDPLAHIANVVDEKVYTHQQGAIPVSIGGMLNVSQLVKPPGSGGYRLVDAVAMADAVLTWAESSYPGSGENFAAWRAALTSWAGPNFSAWGDAARVRGIIYTVVLPVLANEPDGRIWLREWYDQHVAQDLHSQVAANRLAGVGLWIAGHVLGPTTSYVLRPEYRHFTDGWLQPLPAYWADWSEFDPARWQPATLQDQRDALIQIFWRLMSFTQQMCLKYQHTPPYCDLRDQAIADIDGIAYDEQALGNKAEEIAAGNLRRAQLISGAPQRNYFHVAVPKFNIWEDLLQAFCLIASSVVGMPQVGEQLGAALGGALKVTSDVAQLALQIVAAIAHGGDVASIVQAGINTGLVQSLRQEAAMLLPDSMVAEAAGLARAAKIVQVAAQGGNPFGV